MYAVMGTAFIAGMLGFLSDHAGVTGRIVQALTSVKPAPPRYSSIHTLDCSKFKGMR
jgi:hypothetical protein